MGKEKFYQPIYKSKELLDLVAMFRFDLISESDFDPLYDYERVCMDRLIIMVRDLYVQGIYPKASVLDLGCNIGFFSHSLQKIGYDVTGVENNIAQEVLGFSKEKPLDLANKLSHDYDVFPHFIDGDIVDVLENIDCYDVVLFLNILHHFFKGYASQGSCALKVDTVSQLLRMLSEKTDKCMYFEINEMFAEEFGWGRSELRDLVLIYTDFREVVPVGMTVGAGGDLRYVYRCQK